MLAGWGGQALPKMLQAEATTDASLQGLQEMCAQVRLAPAKTSKPAMCVCLIWQAWMQAVSLHGDVWQERVRVHKSFKPVFCGLQDGSPLPLDRQLRGPWQLQGLPAVLDM